jgi:hypothetical protein
MRGVSAVESLECQGDGLIATGPFTGLRANYYPVLFVDPPWDYTTYSLRGTGRGATSHYPTLSFEKTAALPMGALAACDCALFLWHPNWAQQLRTRCSSVGDSPTRPAPSPG